MPVSLCEWRVRIGTFVHWIRDYEIKERKEKLLKERIRRMKILCERLKAKMDDSEQDSEDGENVGKTRHDISNPRKSNQCPHKTTNIKSPGDSSYIKDLLTSCDQCIQDLLTQNYSHIEKILTQSDTSTEHLLGQSDSCLKDLSVLNSSRNHQHTSCGASFEDLTQSNSRINKLLTQSDSCIKELLYSVDSRKDDTLLSAESCRNYQPIQSDSAVNNFFTRADSDSRILLVPSSTNTELKTQSDSYVQDLLKPRDTSINELLTASDSSVKDLLTPRDSYSNEFPTPKDSSVKDSLTPRDCWINELPTSRDASIKESPTPKNYLINELLTASDSSITELLTQEDSLINELLTPKDSSFCEVLTPRDSPRNELPRPRYSITESLTSRDCSINELLTVSDSSITGLLVKEDSLIKELLTPKDPAVYEVLTPRDSSLGELPVPRSIKKSLMPTDSSLTELLKQTDVSMNELQKPTDSPVSELLTPRYFPVDESLTPGDSNVRKLLTLREQVLTKSGVKVHKAKKGFRNEELVDNELKEMKSSYACRKEQLIGVGSMSPVEGTKHDESARHLPRLPLHALSTSTSDCNVEPNRLQKPKEITNESSNSSPVCTLSLHATVDVITRNNPCLADLLLAKAGDVELNPGPHHGSIDSVLEDSELVLLAKDVPGNCYTDLCIGLGFSYTESQKVLTKHLMDITGALIEFLCRWKLKQRDGTDCRAVLAGILGKADIGALQTKLLAGGYLRTETSPSAPDTPQPLIDMTEEQVVQCGHDLQAFYREQMCKIKTDPLDFNSVLEFETIYTNLTLLKSKTQLDYTALLTTEVNGAIPKRLLVEGEGGVGKTTFCSKIAWDWVNGSPQFEQFSWVVVIPLRKIAKGQTIGEIVKNYLSDRNTVTPYQINNYILSEPAKVLIVLDGLDEYDGDLAAEEHSDIAKILRSEKFKECIVLVTTRPWRADQIKSNDDLSRKYAFIGVKGFSPVNVSSYIKKYFVKDKNAGSELIRFIEVNDVIKENMAPFPIYVAMLCILWKNSDSEKRETMRRLKTFSQLFDQMVMFLRDHYVSKLTQILHEAHLGKEMENINSFLLEIGPIAFKGLLSKRLTFNEKDFISCTKAMETCCRIGVLTREKQNISRWERNLRGGQYVTTIVFFPHKLFQEYVSAQYLATLFDTDRKKYNSFLERVMSVANPEEFRYLLYFTAAQGKDVGLDIVEKIPQNKVDNSPLYLITFGGLDTGRKQRTRTNDLLVDITFEAYNKDTAKSVGRRIFAEDKILTIDEYMSAHTLSGYLFIMEHHGMETLIFRGRSCGPTVSRDLADVLCSSSSLSRLEFHRTTLDEDFYRLLQDRASSAGAISVKELCADPQFVGDLHRFDVTVGDLFPGLQQLRLTSPQTVRPGFVERLTHPNLSVLSIESVRYDDSDRSLKDGEEWPVPLIGEPASLGQLFSSSFPHLSSLTFRDLVIGNVRCKAILHSLRNHKHIKSISFTSCFTDDSLDCLASEMSKENGITVSLQHDSAQQQLDFGGDSESRLTPDLMDALCHGTCVRTLVVHVRGMVRSTEWFPELQGREVHSKIQTFMVMYLKLEDDQSASCCLGRFISLVPCLTDLTIRECSFHDEFFKEIADRASSSKIQTFEVTLLELRDQSTSCYLGKFICLLPCLTDLTIWECFFHDEFYREIVDRASSSQIQTFTVRYLLLPDDQSESCCLGKFICLLPCLTVLTIGSCSFHDEFYKEIAHRASSSKIQTFEVSGLKLRDDQSASCCLRKFICLLPCLKDLTISKCSFHDEFYKEIANRASSCKIQTLNMSLPNWGDQVSQSASKQLARFLCSLPSLTDLTLERVNLHDDFYTELTSLAASSQIQTLVMSNPYGLVEVSIGQSASKQLARFLCSLPCLTDLTLEGYDLHDDFYTELTSLAASSQNPYFRNKRHMGMLREWSDRKESCQQQQLNQHHQAVIPAYQHNPRSWEQLGPNILQPRQSAHPSVQYQNDHQRPIQSEHQQVHQFRNAHESGSFQQQLVSCSSHPWPSPQSTVPYQKDLQRRIRSDHQQVHQFTNPHGSSQELGPFHPLQSPQSSSPYQSNRQTCIQSEHVQVQHLLSDLQESTQTPFQPITEHDQSTKTHLNEFDRYFRWYVSAQFNTCNSQSSQYTAESSCHGPKQRSLHSGHIDTTQDTSVGHGQIDAIQKLNDDYLLVSSSEYINSRTSLYRGGHSVGMKPMYEYDDDPDRPSTSGLSSAGISIGPSPWEGERIPSHRKRIHSDSDGDCDDNGGVGVGGNEDDGGVGVGGNEDDGGDNGNTSTTAESLERRPRKRRVKTDRNPASP